MEKAKVFNLIKKFEELSNELSKPKIVPLIKKKEERELSIQKEPQVVVTQQVASTRNAFNSGWSNNPLAEIEQQILELKQSIGDISDDEKILLGLFMDMMDLLIRLSSIDTDGLKFMKLKKEGCLMELKNMKDVLKELIVSGGSTENEQPKEDKVSKEPIGNQHDQSRVDLKQSDELLKPSPSACSKSSSQPNMKDMNLDLGMQYRNQSVHSLTRMFESNHSLNSLPTTPTTPIQKAFSSGKMYSSIEMSLEKIQTDSEDEEDFENGANDDVAKTSSTLNRSSSLPWNDLLSEIDFYKDMVNELDPDDFIRMESVEEYLNEVAPLVEQCDEARMEVEDLLKKLEILKSGHRIGSEDTTKNKENLREQRNYSGSKEVNGTIIEEVEDDEQEQEEPASDMRCDKVFLREKQKQCSDFLYTERNSAVLPQIAKLQKKVPKALQRNKILSGTPIPQIEITEIEDQQAPLIDDTDENEYPSVKLAPKEGTIKILEINIPEDEAQPTPSPGQDKLSKHGILAVSLDKLEHYKNLIRIYLENPTGVIIEHEEAIQEHYNDLTGFIPHENVKQQFAELCEGYKELLDLITEAKFSQTFNSTVENNNDDDMDRDVEIFDSMANLSKLANEISNYHGLIDKLNPKDVVTAEVLKENLDDVAIELEELDALDEDKLEPMREIKELQLKLAAKSQT